MSDPAVSVAGKPWNTVCGHIVALAVALVVHSLELPLFWEKILTPAFAVSAMLYLQVVHCSALAVFRSQATRLGWPKHSESAHRSGSALMQHADHSDVWTSHWRPAEIWAAHLLPAVSLLRL